MTSEVSASLARPPRRFVSLIAAFLVVGVLMVVGPAAANRLSMTLSRQVGPPTASLTITVGGLTPGEQVSVSFGQHLLAEGAAADDGTFEGTGTVPAGARPGKHHIIASVSHGSI